MDCESVRLDWISPYASRGVYLPLAGRWGFRGGHVSARSYGSAKKRALEVVRRPLGGEGRRGGHWAVGDM